MSRGPDIYGQHPKQNIGAISNSLAVSEVIELFDDFINIDTTVTVGDWTLGGDATALASVGDAAGGIVTLSTDGTIEDETWIESVHEIFKFDTDKRVSLEARIACTEVATNVANWAVGLVENPDVNLIADGGVPATTMDGAMFYKSDGDMAINFMSSNATTQTKAEVGVDSVTAQYYRLCMTYDYNDGVTANIWASVYDETADEVYHAAVQTLTISGLGELNVVFYVKGGSGAVQTFTVDYVKVTQER